MKIICLVFCLIFIIQGCANKKEIVPKTNDLQADISIQFGQSNYSGIFTVSETEGCSFQFSEPDVLEGFKLSVKGENLLLDYKGIKSDIPLSDFTQGAVINEIFKCLSSVDIPSIAETNGLYLFEGHCGNTVFKIEFNPDGTPKNIELPSRDIKANFNYKKEN